MSRFHHIDSGQRVTAELLSLNTRAGAQAQDDNAGLESRIAQLEQRLSLIKPSDTIVWTTGFYNSGFPWTQVRRNSANTSWETFTGALTSTLVGVNATHFRGATDLPKNTVAQLMVAVDANGAFKHIIKPLEHEYDAIVTASSGTAPGATYTVKFAAASSAGYGNWAAQASAPGLTAYNLWENIDRVTAGTLTLDPDGDSTDEGTIQNIPNNEIVRIHWAGSGGWWFDKPCDILTDCDAA